MRGGIHMSGFCDTIGLKSFTKDKTCCNNPKTPSSTDLILTNNLRSFQISCAIEKSLSDFHRMEVTIIRKSFENFNYCHFSCAGSDCGGSISKNSYLFTLSGGKKV